MPARSVKGIGTITAAAALVFAAAAWPRAAGAPQGQPAPAAPAPRPAAGPCRVHGVVSHAGLPLPGASIVARRGGAIAAATSTDLDGTYALLLPAGAADLHVELTAFVAADRTVTIDAASCDATVDVDLPLVSRTPGASMAVTAALPDGGAAASGSPGAARAGNAPQAVEATRGGSSAGAGSGQRGRGAGAGADAASRFQSLSVRTEDVASSAAGADLFAADTDLTSDPAARLLPPGFSLSAPTESVAVSGSMVTLDRGMLEDRFAAIGRGEFGLGDAAGPPIGGAGLGGPGGAGGRIGGRGGAGGFGGRGFGGRIGGANRIQVNASYNLGSSAFDSAPYALRGDAAPKQEYLQQSVSTTIGGPVKIPHVYDGTGRTTFNFSYSGNHQGNVFDQYATVPDAAFRAGDFSSTASPIVDPLTGQPFAGNRIPADRLSQTSLALLQFIPEPTLPGSVQNYRRLTSQHTANDTFNVRFTHSLTGQQTGRGGRGGFGGFGGRGGRGGQPAGPARLNATLSAQVSYRRNDGDRLNVFPLLDSTTRGSALSVPISLNMRYGRTVHSVSVSFDRRASNSPGPFAFARNVAGDAGITGIATDPFDWGVPNLTFGSFTSLRDTAPSERTDRTWQVSYGWTRPVARHTFRAGVSFQQENDRTRSDANARGTFTFTGLYTGGSSLFANSGQDFADFLLGLPQQATRQFGAGADGISTPIALRGRQLSAYVQDDWRWKARWTINYGVQYNLVRPFTEADGHLVNLDATPDFTAVAPVESGETGPYSGTFPAGLVNTDWNNVAPRVGVAWRATNRSVVRFGYGLSYNTGAYAQIARQLAQQPPFFATGTAIGTVAAPLTLADAFAATSPDEVTNNYGIARDYQLGLIHQWNVDYNRQLSQTWNAGVTYIGTVGAHLDMLRAPNRGPDGLRIPDVQAFTWQSSEGASRMNGVSFRVQKRQSHGVSGSLVYTLSRSRDDTTATGGGATVAQDDRDLAAEWGLSNFDRRHQVNGSVNVELPFGRDRRWLNQGGWLAAIAGDWRLSANLTWETGTPLTIRCSTCASDVAQGIGGTLRADYTGAPVTLSQPTIDEFFNTAAFAVPAAGTFGNSRRNMVIGPSSHQVNAQFTRDVSLGGTRGLSINVNATNLFNTVNYAAVDTNVNSPTFGEVLSVRPLRTVRLGVRFRF
jgi:hypothetical protein